MTESAEPGFDLALVDNEFETHARRPSKALAREAKHVFSGAPRALAAASCGSLLAVVTMQRARVDLVRMGPEIDAEKDRLLEAFYAASKSVCGTLSEQGYWADYIDPCSGQPMLSGGHACYSEVEGAQVLLRYPIMMAGSCKVVLHPKWGSYVYPASMFTDAPLDAIRAALVVHRSAAALPGDYAD